MSDCDNLIVCDMTAKTIPEPSMRHKQQLLRLAFALFAGSIIAEILYAIFFWTGFSGVGTGIFVRLLLYTGSIFVFLNLISLRYQPEFTSENPGDSENSKITSSIFSSSNEAILITDAHSSIVDVNPAFCRITGYARDELIGKNPSIMKSDRHGADFYRDFWNSLADEGSWQGEIWDRKKDGEIFPKWLSVSTLKDDKGAVTNYIGVFSDISALKQTEEQLQYIAHYDALTHLPNRLLLQDRLGQAILQAKRNNRFCAIMFLDLDRFKNINDTLGHRIGDLLLQEVARRLQELVRKNDTVSRLGGDEFIILACDLDDPRDAAHIAMKIIEDLAAQITIEGHLLYITTSIGIAIYPNDGRTQDQLLKNADAAMYHAKERGKDQFFFFESEMNKRTEERLRIETNLRLAIETEQFVLHYQPRVHLKTGRIVGMEALIRRQEPEWLVPPSYFIPLAEETGLIVQIGEWTMRNACLQTKKWQNEGLTDLRVSMNVSSRQFHNKHFVQFVTEVLKEADLDPHYLELEVTERSALEGIDNAITRMKELKEIGIHLSLDDFGTGYSSLNYLRRLPLNTLKIDRSFVVDAALSREGAAIAKSIITLGRNLNLNILAEGAETEKEYTFLIENDCDELQGFYFSRPLAEAAFKKFVFEKRGLSSM